MYSGVQSPISTDDLIGLGCLSICRIFVPHMSKIDVRGVTVRNGEWDEDEMAERVDVVVDKAVEHYVARCDKEFDGAFPPTLVFAPNAASCETLADAFTKATGEDFVSISYLESATNAARIAAFRAGGVKGLVSCQMVGRGFDVPDVGFIVALRPLRSSMAEWVQQLGRGMRPVEGKDSVIVHDHAGNQTRFAGLMETFWARGVSEFAPPKPERSGEAPEKECPQCGFVARLGATVCSNCGYEFPQKEPDPDDPQLVGEFKEYVRKQEMNRAALDCLDLVGRERFIAASVHANRRKKGNWAGMVASKLYQWTNGSVAIKGERLKEVKPERHPLVDALWEEDNRRWKMERTISG